MKQARCNMAQHFNFSKGRTNAEVFRVGVIDPEAVLGDLLTEQKKIDPSKLSKIELVVGDVVISSPGEITWTNEVITLKPSIKHLALLPRQSRSELVIYVGSESITIWKGFTFVS